LRLALQRRPEAKALAARETNDGPNGSSESFRSGGHIDAKVRDKLPKCARKQGLTSEAGIELAEAAQGIGRKPTRVPRSLDLQRLIASGLP
jgi:hypothetical protein